MTKTTSAKKKFKKCLRINTVLADRRESIYGCIPLGSDPRSPKQQVRAQKSGPDRGRIRYVVG